MEAQNLGLDVICNEIIIRLETFNLKDEIKSELVKTLNLNGDIIEKEELANHLYDLLNLKGNIEMAYNVARSMYDELRHRIIVNMDNRMHCQKTNDARKDWENKIRYSKISLKLGINIPYFKQIIDILVDNYDIRDIILKGDIIDLRKKYVFHLITILIEDNIKLKYMIDSIWDINITKTKKRTKKDYEILIGRLLEMKILYLIHLEMQAYGSESLLSEGKYSSTFLKNKSLFNSDDLKVWETAYSILGSYLNSKESVERPNSIFAKDSQAYKTLFPKDNQ